MQDRVSDNSYLASVTSETRYRIPASHSIIIICPVFIDFKGTLFCTPLLYNCSHICFSFLSSVFDFIDMPSHLGLGAFLYVRVHLHIAWNVVGPH